MNSLRVLGKPYKITWGNLEDCLGETDSTHQTIKMQTGLPKDNEEETLLHELIHAVDESLGLQMTEAQVHALACGLYAVFKDNEQAIKKYHGNHRNAGRKARSPN